MFYVPKGHPLALVFFSKIFVFISDLNIITSRGTPHGLFFYIRPAGNMNFHLLESAKRINLGYFERIDKVMKKQMCEHQQAKHQGEQKMQFYTFPHILGRGHEGIYKRGLGSKRC